MIQFSPQQTTNRDVLSTIARELEVEMDFDNLQSADAMKLRCFSVLDGDAHIGYCLFQILENSTGHLKQIYIKPTERKFKLGDGLFRAVLNSLEIHGVNQVVATGNSEEMAFYRHEGMISAKTEMLERTGVDMHTADFSQYVILESIKDFFSKPCKGHKK